MYFSSKELFIREKSLKCIRNSFLLSSSQTCRKTKRRVTFSHVRSNNNMQNSYHMQLYAICTFYVAAAKCKVYSSRLAAFHTSTLHICMHSRRQRATVPHTLNCIFESILSFSALFKRTARSRQYLIRLL